MLSFLPIAAGYHAAHYLVALLTGGQYAIAALNDPSAAAGASSACPTTGSPSASSPTAAASRAIWNAQFALILGAHLLAVLLGLRLAGRRPRRLRAHLPMTALMVLYTVLGLWLLSTPTAG